MINFIKNHLRKIRVADTLLLAGILLAGAVLRFWRLNDIPFTFDEFSALFRTQFSTFHDLIEKGVKIDTHPAGIQVFLFYLVKLFGISAASVKTPFILFGLLSVWLVYLIGRDWFGSTTGLVAASFVSFLQFPVMYSQIARPYASGLFFCLLMTWFWSRALFHPQRRYYLNLAGYVIAGALCTYNHHFSLLFAAMVGITGLFCCPRNRLLSYVLAGVVVIILYLPHLPIFFTQLGMGGVEGWLHKPRYDFLYDFVRYVFQFSLYVYLLVFLLIILQLFRAGKGKPAERKYLLISLIWFLVPYLVGFFYSRYRNAVLQYSVLIFSFPFLLFILFGYFKSATNLYRTVLVLLIAAVVIPSLIVERQHYRLFYQSPYPEILKESKKALDSLGSSDCQVILDTRQEINNWYLEHMHLGSMPFMLVNSPEGARGMMQNVARCNGNFLAFGCIAASEPVNYLLILEKFPFLVEHKTYAGGNFYLFSKNRPRRMVNEYFFSTTNTFEPSPPEWGYVNEKYCSDSLPIDGARSYVAGNAPEFSPGYTHPLREMLHSEYDVIDITVDVRTPPVFPAAWLVVSITSGSKVIHWNSVPVNSFVEPGHQGKIFCSLGLSDLDFRHHGLVFSTYLWNPGKLTYVMDNFTVKVRNGNPVIYGLIRKI